MSPEEFQAAIDALEAQREAEYQARRAAITPHVRKPATKKVPYNGDGPAYFRLMRAMEADPYAYAEYQALSTYCGAPITTEDWDKRAAVAKKNADAVAARGVCQDCLRIARGA